MIIFTESWGNRLVTSYGGALSDLVTYGKWREQNFTITSQQLQIVAGRTSGSFALQTTNDIPGGNSQGPAYLGGDLGTLKPVLFFAFGFMDIVHLASGPGGRLTFYDDAFVQQLQLRHTLNNQLAFVRGGDGATLATFSNPTFQNRWHYVELGMKIDNATGWLEGRLDGVLVASYYGTTGTSRATANGNTRATTGTTRNGLRMFRLGHVVSEVTRGCYADLVVMDDQGSAHNDFIGDRRVVYLAPTGPGAHTDFAVGGTAPTGGAAAPVAAPAVSKADTGGTIAAGTYLAAYAWRNANGTTQISPTASITTVTATSTITTTPAALPTNVTSWDLYLSQPGGTTLTLQSSGRPSGAFVLTTPPSSTGAAPPATNTTTPNWQATSATPVAGDASYVQSGTAGAMDSYAMADLPAATVSVDAVMVQAIMRKIDAGFRNGAPLLRSGTLDLPFGSTPLQQSYGRLWAITETDPSGAAWTPSSVNALEAGATVVT